LYKIIPCEYYLLQATSKSLINLSNLLLCNKNIFIAGATPKSENALFESDDKGCFVKLKLH